MGFSDWGLVLVSFLGVGYAAYLHGYHRGERKARSLASAMKAAAQKDLARERELDEKRVELLEGQLHQAEIQYQALFGQFQSLLSQTSIDRGGEEEEPSPAKTTIGPSSDLATAQENFNRVLQNGTILPPALSREQMRDILVAEHGFSQETAEDFLAGNSVAGEMTDEELDKEVLGQTIDQTGIV